MNFKKTGVFLWIPYDWRRPTKKRILKRVWNANDSRIFTPKVFGAGWTINWHAVFRGLGLLSKKSP